MLHVRHLAHIHALCSSRHGDTRGSTCMFAQALCFNFQIREEHWWQSTLHACTEQLCPWPWLVWQFNQWMKIIHWVFCSYVDFSFRVFPYPRQTNKTMWKEMKFRLASFKSWLGFSLSSCYVYLSKSRVISAEDNEHCDFLNEWGSHKVYVLQISDGLQDLTVHMKDILKGLRELKKSSVLAFEMLQVFSEEHDNSAVSFLHIHFFRWNLPVYILIWCSWAVGSLES